jgi:ATP-dependent Clp protease ATP-binding subunit ClpA
MNRLDKVVVFRTLTEDDLRQILDIELNDVQNRVIASQTDRQFIFRCTPESKEFLLEEGTDLKYGARHLKRAIERHLVYPLSNLIATGQINQGGHHSGDLRTRMPELVFARRASIPELWHETPAYGGYAHARQQGRRSHCSI